MYVQVPSTGSGFPSSRRKGENAIGMGNNSLSACVDLCVWCLLIHSDKDSTHVHNITTVGGHQETLLVHMRNVLCLRIALGVYVYE